MSKRAVYTVHTCIFLNNNTLMRFESKILDAEFCSVCLFIKFSRYIEDVVLTYCKRKFLGKGKLIGIAFRK